MTRLLIQSDGRGLYCEPGQFHIDPWAKVDRAIITHAHGDHYAWGCGSYLVADEGRHVFRVRLGEQAQIETLPYGEPRTINGVTVSFHPAGHILGSAQIRVEYQGEVWVVSGDYKRAPDTTTTPFEPVPCHTLITEATFGLPIYRWTDSNIIFEQMNTWWHANAEQGKASVLYCYALGKAQRVLSGLNASIGPIYTHGAVEKLNQAYRESGITLPETQQVTRAAKPDFKRSMIITPISARSTPWMRRFGDYSSGYVSGWMRIRGARRQRAVDRGFVLSDHVDWPSLLQSIDDSKAERIFVTHGYVPVVTRWLVDHGREAYPLATRWENEEMAATETTVEGEPLEDGEAE